MGALERQVYLALRLAWRGFRLIPGAKKLVSAVTDRTELGDRIHLMLSPVPPQRFIEPKARNADYSSSIFGKLRPYRRPDSSHYATIESAYHLDRGKEPMSIAFVSAMMGGYERPQRPEHLIKKADYFLVTDLPVKTGSATKLLRADYFDIDPVRMARFVKTHPYLYAPKAKLIIWHDSNVVIRGDLTPLIEQFMASGKPIGVVPHPLRSDVYLEATECVRVRKDDAEVVVEQMSRYMAEGFETDDLVESNLLFLRMDLPKTERFLSRWWAEIDRGSRRDQLSLNYAAAKTGVDFFHLTSRPHSVRNHPLLALVHHQAGEVESVDVDSLLPAAPRRFSDQRDERVARQSNRAVDIVICVHNAHNAIADCLRSVEAHRRPDRHRIVLVDDGSDEPTAALLRAFAQEHEAVTLIRNDVATGYTKAVNVGLRASSAEFVIFLNSDTLVSANFVEKLADAAFSTKGIGIVGPLSNAASAQSIPDIKNSSSQTAINALPPGMTAADLDRWCESNSPASFPRVPLVHGFCFAVTRAAIRAIGEFDEKNFPKGYGEENDYCFRAAHEGVGLAIATSTYVFHLKSQSYSAEQRIRLVGESNDRVANLHGKLRVRRSVRNMDQSPVLRTMRAAAANLFAVPGSNVPRVKRSG